MDVTPQETMRIGQSSSSSAFDVNRILSGFRRHLRLFLAVFLVIMIIVAGSAFLSAPRYTSTATILIAQHDTDALHLNTLSPADAGSPVYSADSSAVDTQAKILLSRSLAAQVVDQLHLDQDPEFNGSLRQPGRLAAFKKWIGGGFLAKGDNVDDRQREHEDVVDAVIKDLVVKRADLTYAIDVGFTSFEPAKAQIIANAFVQRYLTQQLESKFDESSRGTNFLNTHLVQLRGEMEAADAAVQNYKIANNLLSAQGATLTEQQISNLDSQVATSRAQDAEQDARLATAQHQLAAGSVGDDVSEAMTSPVIQQLRAQRAQASAQLADLQGRYGDRHPDIIKAKRSLDDIDAQIHTEILRVISNLKAQSQITHSRTAAIVSSANQTRGTLVGNNKALVKLNQLQTNDDAARTLYEGFLARYKEALAKEGNQQADARVVSQAQLPTVPSAPNKKLAFLLAIVLGFAGGVGASLLAELLKRGISSTSEAENAYDLPCLAELPSLSSTLEGPNSKLAHNPLDYVVAKPLSRFSESFRNLRASVASSRVGAPPRVIAVTSSLPGEGKTTTCFCLARTAALGGATTVLVDADLRQRAISKLLPAVPKIGLLEVLNGTATLDRALVLDPATGAYILPLADSSFTPRDVFGSEPMGALLDELKRRFEVVIIDTAPVLAVADTRVLCPRADAVLFLIRWRKTPRKAIAAALKALTSGSSYISGMAITQVNVREQARVGEGAARYYRDYAKYYSE